ncbi:hypothetical protein BpHYR1_038655 [Brachionus plicatilis]|uniref:Uncharacterized protein n=1 Tax=Brachionus plicatilis TaxID=10195 RepID=A0A3M7RKZ8_BRAPC|nr:hypothetical protein BpHYR1_038655 [Brachionus plicatilis]
MSMIKIKNLISNEKRVVKKCVFELIPTKKSSNELVLRYKHLLGYSKILQYVILLKNTYNYIKTILFHFRLFKHNKVKHYSVEKV